MRDDGERDELEDPRGPAEPRRERRRIRRAPQRPVADREVGIPSIRDRPAGERAPREEQEPGLEFAFDPRIARWGLDGVVIGALLGTLVGIALATGPVMVPGLAPLVGGGLGPFVLSFAGVGAALFGLLGALVATERSAPTRPLSGGERGGHGGHASGEGHNGGGERAFLTQRLPVFAAIALVAFMTYTLVVIARHALGGGEASSQANRVTWNQKNATRVGGLRDEETAARVLQIAYPATRPENSAGEVIEVPGDWRAALAATPLIAPPVSAALVVASMPVDSLTAREVARLRASALRRTPPSMTGDDAAATAAAVDARLAGVVGGASPSVIVVASDADASWALPAAAYAARTGTPILFVDQGGLPATTERALAARQGQAQIFVLGPPTAVDEARLAELAEYGRVVRITGGTFARNAVAFAEFRDDSSAFGWGHTPDAARAFSSSNTILVNAERWQDAIMAAHLARAGKSGPLLFADRDGVPAVVERHLWRIRPTFAATPSEGPFNHLWVVGSFDRIGYLTQAWGDYSQEIAQYMTRGDSALSGFEALTLVWIALALASAWWVAWHAVRRLTDVMPAMKVAWSLFALLLGPVGAWAYARSYHRRRRARDEHGMVHWQRPTAGRVVSATVMMFGLDMLLMVLAVFLLAYAGFPLVRSTGPLYWMGSSMFLMMVGMYAVALVLMMLAFHTPMTMHERRIPSYWRAFAVGFPIMVATMTVESLGMMPAMWWAQMSFLPGMQMPTEDDLTMWGTLIMAVVAGFVVVLPFNAWLVKRGVKLGRM